MKSPELLRREELLELAALDAMGQLDEFEADHYTRSFHAAPASVQEEIRRLQAEIATDEAFLSDEEMPADLKARVMGAVTAAIDEEAAALRPIASIGVRGTRPTSCPVAGSIEMRSVETGASAAEAAVLIERA